MIILKKQDLLLSKLYDFYKTDNNYNILLNIINGYNNISLRIIDWFITNYSKKYNIFWINNNNRFVIYLNYKLQLKAYSKKQFDPFCRRERITFTIDDKPLVTTVGQLNFFKWIIENNIIDYIINNIKDIEYDMHNTLKNAYNTKSKTRKKRHEISISATKIMNKHNIDIVLQF